MNGYLGLLAERTLGVMPTLRPRPRSLFEPALDSVALEEAAAPLLESPPPNRPSVPAATGPARSGTDHIDDPPELIAGAPDGLAATITTPADEDRAGAPHPAFGGDPAAPAVGDVDADRGPTASIGLAGFADRSATHLPPTSATGPPRTGDVVIPDGWVASAASPRPIPTIGHGDRPGQSGTDDPAGLPGSIVSAAPAAGRMDEPGVVATGLPGRVASVAPVAGRSEELGQASPGLPAGLPGRVASAMPASGRMDEPDVVATGLPGRAAASAMPASGRMDEPDVVATGLPGRAAASAMAAAGRSEEPGQASPGLLAGLPGRAAPATATTGTTDEPDPSLTRASGDTQPTGPGTAVTGVGKPAAAGSAWLPVRSRLVGTPGGETPTVTVHIGRVEVRRLPPPPPPASTPEPGPQPLTLEAYLDRRTGGSR
jgi:hypothetical protein